MSISLAWRPFAVLIAAFAMMVVVDLGTSSCDDMHDVFPSSSLIK